jgi:hypothetical protein
MRTTLARQAGRWLACLVLFLALSPPDSQGQSRRYRPPARYIQIGQPDQAEGRRILEGFRQSGLSGDYYLEFDLRVLPRRGETRVVSGGRLWGGRNESGPISRVELPAFEGVAGRRLLVQNGPRGSVWVAAETTQTAMPGALDPAALFAPLAGTDINSFDLQMPFLFWSDFVFEGIAPVRGRPAHVFLFYPPDDIVARKPELAGVRVFLDTQFGALVQAQQLGAEERVLKSMTVLDLKKVDEQWMVKTIDFRDETTRGKTQFVVTSAALGLDFSAVVFTPDALAAPVSPPPIARLSKLTR